MNYLAHFLLSENDPELLTGNFIADHVKGKAFEEYSLPVQRGILMHREIDFFTDSHELVKKSKKRLFPKYHHYASVIVDMFYDHLLAKNWADYSPEILKDFTAACYAVLKGRRDIPLRAQFMLGYMSEQDWLSNYASIEGIDRSLTGLSNRSSFESNMQHASAELSRDYDLYQEEFRKFFPQLQSHCTDWLRSNGL